MHLGQVIQKKRPGRVETLPGIIRDAPPRASDGGFLSFKDLRQKLLFREVHQRDLCV